MKNVSQQQQTNSFSLQKVSSKLEEEVEKGHKFENLAPMCSGSGQRITCTNWHYIADTSRIQVAH